MKHKFEFRNILSLVIVINSYLYAFAFFFIKVPTENKSAVDMLTGAMIIAAAASVTGFHFGSSKTQTPSGATQNIVEGDARITNQTPVSVQSPDEVKK